MRSLLVESSVLVREISAVKKIKQEGVIVPKQVTGYKTRVTLEIFSERK